MFSDDPGISQKMTLSGSEFEIFGAATGIARLLTVDSLYGVTLRRYGCWWNEDCRVSTSHVRDTRQWPQIGQHGDLIFYALGNSQPAEYCHGG